MKKTILLFAFILGAFGFANAQAPEGFQFGAGLRVALPIGDFADTHSFGLGGELQGEYGFSENVSGVFTTGYTNFFGKDASVGGLSLKFKSIGYTPVIVGARFYSSNFFFGGQVGLGIFSGGGGSSTGFNWLPQIGYNADNFQLALGFSGVSKNGTTSSHLGLSGIFKFGGNGNASK